MRFDRSSGVLLHLTCLPNRFGIGDLGREAYEFVEFLQRAGQRIWQVLPVGPTAKGNSPYTSYSAFAGNPLLISPQRLVDDGFLDPSALRGTPSFTEDVVDYEGVVRFKEALLRRSFEFYRSRDSRDHRSELGDFCQRNRWWLEDYALFVSLMREFGTADWSRWDPALARRDARAIEQWTEKLSRDIELVKYEQFLFFRQWKEFKSYANHRGVRVFGDLAIFVAYESADVWANQGLFHLGPDGQPTVVAGVPPDYFSETGQLWGNPLYRWETMESDNYGWWLKRLSHALSQFDLLRIDHFRGFAAYWEVPADAETAQAGRWVKGPGIRVFREAEKQLGKELPIVAEDLGLITPEVHQLRDDLGFPGMRVLQFGFAEHDSMAYHWPHNFEAQCVAYTGTHDNDTTCGWYGGSASGSDSPSSGLSATSKKILHEYLGTDGREIHWDLIRAALTSVAVLSVIPMQDLLGLGSEARMNIPGTPDGNWDWRFQADMLTPEIEQRLRYLTEISGRI